MNSRALPLSAFTCSFSSSVIADTASEPDIFDWPRSAKVQATNAGISVEKTVLALIWMSKSPFFECAVTQAIIQETPTPRNESLLVRASDVEVRPNQARLRPCAFHDAGPKLECACVGS